MSIPDQSIECVNPNCGCGKNAADAGVVPARPWVCGCGHNRSWHDWQTDSCRLCAQCGKDGRDHAPGLAGHRFKHCQCPPDSTETAQEGNHG